MIKKIKKGGIRTRFAPSPTGFFHIGSARTALFNYLFSRKNKGGFILRIEDTDKERSKPEFEEDIIESLKWLGIESDGTFRQSDRKDVFKKYIVKLLEENKAYYCFCAEEELEAKRQEKMSRGAAPVYNGKCANLSKKEVEEKLKNKEKFIIRFKVPHKKVVFDDLIRGRIEFDAGLIGDIAVARDLDAPLYNLAVVIDDYEMGITHVIRGEDLMPNTPKQILLQEALGFPGVQYGHLPLILGPDRSKLSKRHGATSLGEYKEQGYLSEAIINFLAFLGWNPGDEREIFSLNSLIKEFSLEHVQKSGAVFNIEKLDYLNGFYIRQKSTEKLAELCLPYLIKDGILSPVMKSEKIPASFGGMGIFYDYMVNDTQERLGMGYLYETVGLYRERLKKLSEISGLINYFFKKKLDYDGELLFWKDMTKEEVVSSIDKLINILSKIKSWNKKEIEKSLTFDIKNRGAMLWPLRAALSGKRASAGPFEIAEVLGKDRVLERLNQAKNKLK